MSDNSDNQVSGATLDSAAALCRQEIARLKGQLEVIKAGSHPRRRAMIIDHVSRIDERQDALDKLRASDARSKER